MLARLHVLHGYSPPVVVLPYVFGAEMGPSEFDLVLVCVPRGLFEYLIKLVAVTDLLYPRAPIYRLRVEIIGWPKIAYAVHRSYLQWKRHGLQLQPVRKRRIEFLAPKLNGNFG